MSTARGPPPKGAPKNSRSGYDRSESAFNDRGALQLCDLLRQVLPKLDFHDVGKRCRFTGQWQQVAKIRQLGAQVFG